MFGGDVMFFFSFWCDDEYLGVCVSLVFCLHGLDDLYAQSYGSSPPGIIRSVTALEATQNAGFENDVAYRHWQAIWLGGQVA